MKKYKLPFAVIIIVTVFLVTSFSKDQNIIKDNIAIQDTLVKYPDGIYEGQSRSAYIEEPYWGKVQLTIEKGLVTRVNFVIRDSNLHETFNQDYEKHFEGNPLYIQQSRNDWNGVKTYPGKLLEAQNINKVDAVSGATWSYNIFRAAVIEALKTGYKPQ